MGSKRKAEDIKFKPRERKFPKDELITVPKSDHDPGYIKVGFFKKTIHWLNGKKFWGGLLIGLGGIVFFSGLAETIIGNIGLSIAGIGGAHKVVKANAELKKGGEFNPKDWRSWIDLLIELLKQFKTLKGGIS